MGATFSWPELGPCQKCGETRYGAGDEMPVCACTRVPPTPAPSPSVEEARELVECLCCGMGNYQRIDNLDALITAAKSEGRRELSAELLSWADTVPANIHLDFAKELRRRIAGVDVQPEQARGCATKVI